MTYRYGKYLRLFSSFVLTSAFLITTSAQAAAPIPVLPGSVDPQKLQERLTPQTKVRQGEQFLPELRDTLPDKPPPVKNGFILKGVVIEGATAFTPDELAKTYKAYLGKKADLATMQFIAARITHMYRKRGYFLSKALVPEQKVTNGKPHIVIIEGYVARVTLKGNALNSFRRRDLFGVMHQMAHGLTNMRPLNGKKLERLLLLMNDLGSVNVHAVMEALPKDSAARGAVGMVLQVEGRPRELSASVDNFGSRYAGPVEFSATATVNNAFLAFDRASLSLLTVAPTREVKAGNGSYTLPLNTNGTSLNIHLGYSTLNPGYTLKSFDVHSESYNAGVAVTQNLIRSRQTNVSVSAGVDAANIFTDLAGTTLYKDRIRALRLNAQFDRMDDLDGSLSGNFGISQGLDFLGARKSGSLDLSRAKGRSDFTKLTASLSRLQQAGSDLQLFASATGQYAWSPLLSSEEFGYGGQAFGRAYDPSEITGDRGIAGSLEVRYNGFPVWQHFIFQPFAFYDIGKVWKIDDGTSDAVVSGTSAGIGLRYARDQWLSGSFTAAVPLTRPASAPPPYSDGNNPRFLFQITGHF